MRKLILLIILTTAAFVSCRQASKTHPEAGDTAHFNTVNNKQNADTTGIRVTIHNSLPKGGTRYTAPNGNVYSYAVYWSQLINETDKPLELNIHFPVTPYEMSNLPGKYFKVLSPPDTMTADKISLNAYGLTGIDTFLDKNLQQTSSWSRTIHPKEASGFYIILLIMSEEATGMTRTALRIKGRQLYYTISRYSMTQPITLIEEKEILCGSIN